MPGGFSVVPGDLEEGSGAISGHAAAFGGIGETFSDASSSGTEFGSLPSSGRVSSLTSQLSAVHRGQFSAARTALTGAASAVRWSGRNYAAADQAAGSAAHGIVAE